MKRIIALTLASVLALSASGCSSKTPATESETKEPSSTTITTESSVETTTPEETTPPETTPAEEEVNTPAPAVQTKVEYPEPKFYDTWLPKECWEPLPPDEQGVIIDDVIPDHGQQYKHPFKVYLPHDYETSNKKYNVVILLHASYGDGHEFTDKVQDVWYADPMRYLDLYDQVQRQHLSEPFIVICPEYNKWWSAPVTHEGIAKEIKNYLLPYIAEKYRTYIDGTSLEDLIAAREHIAMGGGSLGAEFTFGGLMQFCTDVCANFVPMSAFDNFQSTEKALRENNEKYPIKLFYYVTGDNEMHEQMDTYNRWREILPDVFTDENTIHCLVKGGHHSYNTWAVGFWNFIQIVFDRTPESLIDTPLPEKEATENKDSSTTEESKPVEDKTENENNTNNPVEDKADAPVLGAKPTTEEGKVTESSSVTGPKKTYMSGANKIPDMEWKGIQRLCQQDDAWAAEPYGVISVAKGGCGLVSLSRAITYQYGEEVLPTDLIDMKSIRGNGLSYRKANTRGTDSSLFPEWASQFGLECRRTNNPNIAAYEMLNRGAVSVSKMTHEPLGPGHYVFFAEWLKDEGKVVVMDPTIENLIVTPDGIYNQGVMFRACGEYALIYPKGTTGIPSQEEFTARQAKTLYDIKYYDQIKDGWMN